MQLPDIQTPLSRLSPEEQRALIRQIQIHRRSIPKLVQEKIDKKNAKDEADFLMLFKKSNLTIEDLQEISKDE